MARRLLSPHRHPAARRDWAAARRPILALACAWLAACAPTSHVLVGTARAPIPVSQVRIYTEAPKSFEVIATLDASGKSIFSGSLGATNKAVDRLRAEAAKLGANGIILDGLDEAQSSPIGGGVSSDSYSNHGNVSLGIGGFLGIFKTTGKGRAVYVPTS